MLTTTAAAGVWSIGVDGFAPLLLVLGAIASRSIRAATRATAGSALGATGAASRGVVSAASR
jgi:hypothetical protein